MKTTRLLFCLSLLFMIPQWPANSSPNSPRMSKETRLRLYVPACETGDWKIQWKPHFRSEKDKQSDRAWIQIRRWDDSDDDFDYDIGDFTKVHESGPNEIEMTYLPCNISPLVVGGKTYNQDKKIRTQNHGNHFDLKICGLKKTEQGKKIVYENPSTGQQTLCSERKKIAFVKFWKRTGNCTIDPQSVRKILVLKDDGFERKKSCLGHTFDFVVKSN